MADLRVNVRGVPDRRERLSPHGEQVFPAGQYSVAWDCRKPEVSAEVQSFQTPGPAIPEPTLYAALAALPEAYEDILGDKLLPYAFDTAAFDPVAVLKSSKPQEPELTPGHRYRAVFVCTLFVSADPNPNRGRAQWGSVVESEPLRHSDGSRRRCPHAKPWLLCGADARDVRSEVRHELAHVAFRALLAAARPGSGRYRFWDFFCIAFEDWDRRERNLREAGDMPPLPFLRANREAERPVGGRTWQWLQEAAERLPEAKRSLAVRVRVTKLYEHYLDLQRTAEMLPPREQNATWERNASERYWELVKQTGPGLPVATWLHRPYEDRSQPRKTPPPQPDELLWASVAAATLRRHDRQWPAPDEAKLEQALDHDARCEDSVGDPPRLWLPVCHPERTGRSPEACHPGYSPWALARALRLGGLGLDDHPWDPSEPATPGPLDSHLGKTLLAVLREGEPDTVADAWAQLLLRLLLDDGFDWPEVVEPEPEERPRFILFGLSDGDDHWGNEARAWDNAFEAFKALEDRAPEDPPVALPLPVRRRVSTLQQLRGRGLWPLDPPRPTTIVVGGAQAYRHAGEELHVRHDQLEAICELASQEWVERVLVRTQPLPEGAPEAGFLDPNPRLPRQEHVLRWGMRSFCARDPRFRIAGWTPGPFDAEEPPDLRLPGPPEPGPDPDDLPRRILSAVRFHVEALA